ncbi:MAG: phosphoenolpyruvate synthase [Firmicutes bacterium]|nr:phosphoenolpyruvate synthase [Bacillota bacterium]
MPTYVLPFNAIDKTSLPLVGGKGANLGEMTQAGFPVPQGFCVTTSAYRLFLSTSNKVNDFFNQLDHVRSDSLDDIRVLGEQIRSHLEALPIPQDIEAAIINSWKQNGREQAYAVRSSATAEDLPSASFAGQQETYLNVIGQDQLLNSVRRCFASLFTDRAISYRAKNGFDHRQVFLSVVIQEMVFPEVSGIMFTADPISGNRKVTSIDASFGLGEALVSGLVSADLYQFRDGQIIQKRISNKKIAIYALPEGSTVTKALSLEQQQAQSLPDDRIIELAALGQKIKDHYGTEQDIEWCLANGKFYIVQSRPITSLYPVPLFSDQLPHILASIGHIQMMTDTMEPLAISIFEVLFPFVHQAGGRAFADVTPILGIKPLRKRIPRILRHMDEQLGAALEEAADRYANQIPSKRIPVWKISSFVRPVITTIIKNLWVADPKQGRVIVTDLIDQSVVACRERVLNQRGLKKLDAMKDDLRFELPKILPKVVPYWMTSLVASAMIKKMLEKWLGSSDKMDVLNRSLPGNVTSELGLMIGDLADIVRQNQRLADHLQVATDEHFYEGMDEIPGGHLFRQEFERFLTLYGMRCPGEIDISRPRWREAPSTLVAAIFGHVRTVGPGEHRIRFEQGAREAEQAAREIVASIRKKSFLKAKMVSRLINVYRNLGGLREHHKYLAVQHLDIFRQAILDEARLLVQAGVLVKESDVFRLTLDELYALVKGELTSDIQQLISERKKQQAANEKLTPPRVMTNEGEIITGRKRAVKAPEGALVGTPVSSGVVEGYAKIVLRPEEARLQSGEIMIAPFTDPGWTPLFHSARALVMEVGGLMTHGAVVAREYGIPAVVGIDGATSVIQDGDYIRVDGTHGYVEILQHKKEAAPIQ